MVIGPSDRPRLRAESSTRSALQGCKGGAQVDDLWHALPLRRSDTLLGTIQHGCSTQLRRCICRNWCLWERTSTAASMWNRNVARHRLGFLSSGRCSGVLLPLNGQAVPDTSMRRWGMATQLTVPWSICGSGTSALTHVRAAAGAQRPKVHHRRGYEALQALGCCAGAHQI